MLSHFLEDVLEDFKSASAWYTKGIHANDYPEELVLELNDICHRIRVLKSKLDADNFRGSYRYSREDADKKFA